MTDSTAKPEVLRSLFLGHQATLQAELIQARTAIEHPTMKGDASEDSWREMLAHHLPRRYRVCRGVVVDSRGEQSDAIDVIIHDAHFCPLFLDRAGSCFVPAESVYAIFETKQALTASEVQYAGEKAESVRRLYRTSAPIVDRGESRPPRPVPPILAGIVGLRAEWADGLGVAFKRSLSRLDADQCLDLGCALANGAFERDDQSGEITLFPSETALVSFFLRLVDRLQQVGTVPAISWEAYSASLRT
jgi:hypothetical protein